MDTSTGLSSIASLSLLVSMSMSGTSSRVMLARSAASFIPALLVPRHRLSNGSSGGRSSPGAVSYTQSAQSVAPPFKHRREPSISQVAEETSAGSSTHHISTSQYLLVPKCSLKKCQPEIEIVVHHDSDYKAVRLISDVPHNMLTKSRSENTLQSTSTSADVLVAVGNGYIHTT